MSKLILISIALSLVVACKPRVEKEKIESRYIMHGTGAISFGQHSNCYKQEGDMITWQRMSGKWEIVHVSNIRINIDNQEISHCNGGN